MKLKQISLVLFSALFFVVSVSSTMTDVIGKTSITTIYADTAEPKETFHVEGDSISLVEGDEVDGPDYVIPIDTVKEISINARRATLSFNSMTAYPNLETITFSKECELHIDRGAFYGNSKLTEIILPATTKNIEGAFLSCSNLTQITFDGENDRYEVVNGCVVTKEERPHLIFVPADTTDFIVPDNIAVIETYAFANCRKLESVMLNEGLETIREGAFVGCNLNTLNIPASVKEIECAIVANNQNLTSISVDRNNPYFQSNKKAIWTKSDKKLLAAIAKKGVCEIPKGIVKTDILFLANTKRVNKIIFPATLKKWIDVTAYAGQKLSFKGKKPPKVNFGIAKTVHTQQILNDGKLKRDADGNYIGKPRKNKRTILIHKKYKKNYTAWLRNKWGYKYYNKDLKVKMY